MDFQEERKWWEMRIKFPFVGDLQNKLDEFQEKLIAAGEEPIRVPNYSDDSFCKSLFGHDLF